MRRGRPSRGWISALAGMTNREAAGATNAKSLLLEGGLSVHPVLYETAAARCVCTRPGRRHLHRRLHSDSVHGRRCFGGNRLAVVRAGKTFDYFESLHRHVVRYGRPAACGARRTLQSSACGHAHGTRSDGGFDAAKRSKTRGGNPACTRIATCYSIKKRFLPRAAHGASCTPLHFSIMRAHSRTVTRHYGGT